MADAIPYTEERYATELRELQAVEFRQIRRRERFAKLEKNACTTGLVAIIVISLIAGVSDLLSIIDVGWITAWASSLLMGVFIKNRTNAIHKAVEAADEFSEELSRDLHIFAPDAVVPETTSKKLSSYTKIFIRDTIIIQLVELIPIVDILPFYVGQVVKALIDQKRYREEAKRAISHCAQLLGILEERGV